jgi:hypothetical protein
MNDRLAAWLDLCVCFIFGSEMNGLFHFGSEMNGLCRSVCEHIVVKSGGTCCSLQECLQVKY